ncbi:MAG: transcription-repair coupling factor, partial [Actinomycetota bacterium]
MLGELLDLLTRSESFERVIVHPSRPVVARAGAGRDLVVAALARSLGEPVLAVAPGPREAAALAAGVGAFLGRDAVALFPAWEALPYDGIDPSPEVAAQRAEAARRARAARGPFVLVAPIAAALQVVPDSIGLAEPLRLAVGADLAPDALADRLAALGYARADVVEHRGEFAVRGGIVDVFPGGSRRPARVEFVGDEVESLRAFVPATQRSAGALDAVDVHPVRELPPDASARAAAVRTTDLPERTRDRLARLAEGLVPDGAQTLVPFLCPDAITVADLLPRGAWTVLAPSRRTLERAASTLENAALLAEASAWSGPAVLRDLETALGGRQRLDLSEFAEGIDLGFEDWGTAVGNVAEAIRDVGDLRRRGWRVLVTASGQGNLDRAREVFADAGVALPAADLVEAPVAQGFRFADAKVAVCTEEDLFGSRRHTRTAPNVAERRADPIAEDLVPGELAVHRVHGVGRFVGIQRREVAGSERDYMVLEYADGDRLSVPTDQVGMVARYQGGEAPRLHRLGTSDWVSTTRRVKRAVRDMAGELVRLYAARLAAPGRRFGPDTPWQREMEDAFPHEETRDQLAAIQDVKGDMQRDRPMDRLICGDVGYGKTEIAVRAAFKAVMEGTQVAVLVPTTLLAEQHYVTFSERFAPFPVKVAMLSRFLSKADQRRVVEDLAAGRVDVVVGTHRLISSDIAFADLGLLIVDEEQRFGVAHKERLKRLKTSVDVLTMTATPIPRTLEMALTGIRDMSVVDTPPEDRQPILTSVVPYSEEVAIGAVRRELLRGGQVFWLHNRVATLDRQAAWLAERVPDARVVTAHGQMDEDDLERQMLRFWNREADVLVCTTIIESGLDVPSANTLVVDHAELLGLAQMYQLRGRVGRSAERAFAYFFFPEQRSLTEEATLRLETISRHTALGSGFRIALRDLEIRGAGNVLGAEQHGHIAAVGFDTYARLLRESVAELQGEPIVEEREVRIDLPVKAYVPVGWIAQEGLRLELYRRIAAAGSRERLAEVRAEAEDRYGRLPDPVEVLLAVASLRLACREVGVEEVSTLKDRVRVRPFDLVDLPEGLPSGSAFHAGSRTLTLVPG